jgi:hypothetical protein
MPLQPRGKLPLTEHGSRDASADAATIYAWWARWPDANIGIATGDWLIVLDIDGPEGHATWQELERQHGENTTLSSRTGTGGRHLLYHTAKPLPNSARKLGPGIDTRGTGGYIVAPPSIHPNGRPYAWESRLPIAPVPAFIVEALIPRRPAYAAPARTTTDGTPYGWAALDAEAAIVATTGPGARNHTLNVAAFKLGGLEAGGELPVGASHDQLLAAAHACGLGEQEARATIASGLKAGRQQPRSAPGRAA